ncbi:MAG: PTPA-CTERM sorting domain-containing protein [Leptolyngbya sp. BL-A-14]
MNFTFQKTWAAVAATVALSTGMLAVSGSAQAFLITRTTGTSPLPGINAPLPAPTVIDFDGLQDGPPAGPNPVPTAPTSIGPGGPNGGAKIQNTDGVATFQGNFLRIGDNGLGASNRGTVSFVFGDPRGMGYLGLNWQNPRGNESISFFSGNTLIQTITGATLDALSGGGNYFNFFVTNNSEIFNRIDLTRTPASGNAFQVDNLAYQAIPTPALLPGLLAMGVGVWRKRKAAAEAKVDA